MKHSSEYLPVVVDCVDCAAPAETNWFDGSPVFFPCAYSRANWNESEPIIASDSEVPL